MKKDEDLKSLLILKHGSKAYVNWFQDGGGKVWRIYDAYILFQVSLYGGEPQYVETYHKRDLNELIHEVYLWT